MNRIGIIDTTLRDAQQCLWNSQMQFVDLEPILTRLDDAGYAALEVWGGELFAASLQDLSQDPWKTLAAIRKRVQKTPLQAFIQGQFLVGRTPFSADIVSKFLEKSHDQGISIFRLFDPLNDWRNLELSVQKVRKLGAQAQGVMVFTSSPVHDQAYYLNLAEQMVQLGVDSLCLADWTGCLTPTRIGDLVREIKKRFALPLALHVHYNGAMAMGTCLSAADAGIDLIDTASAPLAFGASLPPVETLVHCLKDGGFDSGLKQEELFDLADYFEEVRKKGDFERGITKISDIQAVDYQVPGYLLQQIEARLRNLEAGDCLVDLLQEIEKIRQELGYPPLVDHIGKMVVNQAFLNLFGEERYQNISDEFRNYLRGIYGQAPGSIEPAFRLAILGDIPMIQGRVTDYLPYCWERLIQETKDWAATEEEVLTYALFPELARQISESNFLAEEEAALEPLENKETESLSPEEYAAFEASGLVDVLVALDDPSEELSDLCLDKSCTLENSAEEETEMKMGEIKELLTYLNGSGVTEFALENREFKVQIKRSPTESVEGTPFDEASTSLTGSGNSEEQFSASAKQEKAGNQSTSGLKAGSPARAPQKCLSSASRGETKEENAPGQGLKKANLLPITASIVGRFYRSQSPGSPPFVEVGTKVEAGQTLCIVEAMKIMNEILAETDGTIVEIVVENGKSVQFGQTLMLLEPASEVAYNV